MACDNTNTGLWLCCGTLRGAEEEEEAAGVTPWRDGSAEVTHWGSSVAQNQQWGHKQLQPFLLETFQTLIVTGLETPPVARNCSCTSNTAFRNAFCVFAN